MGNDHAWTIDEIARDLDLVVFELELAPSDDPDALREERRKLRARLERLRERLQDVTRKMM